MRVSQFGNIAIKGRIVSYRIIIFANRIIVFSYLNIRQKGTCAVQPTKDIVLPPFWCTVVFDIQYAKHISVLPFHYYLAQRVETNNYVLNVSSLQAHIFNHNRHTAESWIEKKTPPSLCHSQTQIVGEPEHTTLYHASIHLRAKTPLF